MGTDASGTWGSRVDRDIARKALEFDVPVVGRRREILEHLGSIGCRGVELDLCKARADPIDRDDTLILNVDRVAGSCSKVRRVDDDGVSIVIEGPIHQVRISDPSCGSHREVLCDNLRCGRRRVDLRDVPAAGKQDTAGPCVDATDADITTGKDTEVGVVRRERRGGPKRDRALGFQNDRTGARGSDPILKHECLAARERDVPRSALNHRVGYDRPVRVGLE